MPIVQSSEEKSHTFQANYNSGIETFIMDIRMQKVIKTELIVDSFGTRATAQLETNLDGGIYKGPVSIKVRWSTPLPLSTVTFHVKLHLAVLSFNPGGRILLFENEDFKGKLVDVIGPTNLFPTTLDNDASSFIVVEGNWLFYNRKFFSGLFLDSSLRVLVFKKGFYRSMQEAGIGIGRDLVSSLRTCDVEGE